MTTMQNAGDWYPRGLSPSPIAWGGEGTQCSGRWSDTVWEIIQTGKTNVFILDPTTSQLRVDLNQIQASHPWPGKEKWHTSPPHLRELRGLERRCAGHQTKTLPNNNPLNK